MSTVMKHMRRAAGTILAGVVASVLLFGAAYAQNVVVRGNRQVDSETIRSYVTPGASPAQIREALIASGMFSSVNVSQKGGQTVVSVKEARGSAVGSRIINSVQFEGNKKLEKTQLAPELRSQAYGTYSQAMVNADAEMIREIYRRGGRGLATVTPRIVELSNGKVDVVFTINEGDKTGVKEINFIGNEAISAWRLRNQMTTTEMNFISFLKNSDIYDPDRIASDEELIRRYYLKNGYADFRITRTDVQFDAQKGGYIITIYIEEGRQYRIGSVRVDSRIPAVDAAGLERKVAVSSGDVYNGTAVEKSLQDMTVEVAKRGHAFAQVRPVGTRDPVNGTINIGYVVEDGPRVYIERINVRGNTRTLDSVIRREFDLGEGDAYNRVLIDRAERRLNALGYFKKVRITNEPGSAPDRVVVNVDVEDQSTGSVSFSGGYSTSDGVIGEVSMTETNFLGRGQYVRIAGSLGENSRGFDFSFTEPYFLGYRMAAGIDVFSKYTDLTKYSRYENRMTGFQLRLGLPITEEFSATLRYSLYEQDVRIPNTVKEPFNDCSAPIPGYTQLNPDGMPNRLFCENNGEASLALKEAAGKTLTSLIGPTLVYSTLDNRRDPRDGLYAEVKVDVAGLGGDSKFFRIAGDARYYRELTEDLVGMVRVQGGHIQAFGDGKLNIIDNFFLGPTLVRGFAPAGIGPRDISGLDSRSNAIGGTTYFGATVEVQFPILGIPREFGLKGAVFADAGTLFGYKGNTLFDIDNNSIINGYDPVSGACQQSATKAQECIRIRDNKMIRSSVGASLLWASPLGPIRFDYAYALTKDDGEIINGIRVGGDRTQAFRMSSGFKY